MATNTVSCKELVNHLSRLEGQLASIRVELERTTPDCDRASTTLRAASRSLSAFRQSFVQCFLESVRKEGSLGVKTTTTYQALLNVIKS